MTDLSIVLLHYPVLDKNGAIVTSALTNIDVHDIARSARTFGFRRFFVATPVRALRLLAERIIEHWDSGFGAEYNATRKDALSIVRLVADLDETMITIEQETGVRPRVVMTSARPGPDRTSFAALRAELESRTDPHLVVLGTGWGLAPEVTAHAEVMLEPIWGPTDYNHLSVRAAAAIILDRLCGAR